MPFVSLHNALEAWQTSEYGSSVQAADDRVVKLNSNENPYGPSGSARRAIIDAIDSGNRYPRPAIRELREQIAAHEGLSPDQIIITAGSTELLGVVGLMGGIDKGTVIGCDPTFDFMLHYARHVGARWVKVPLTEDHHYDLRGINNAVDNHTKLIFICNPNNPTGTELPRSILQPFCEVLSERCLVYIDEAYIEFARDGLRSSLAPLTGAHPNLIVGRTFSKVYGLAGMRIGYGIAHPDTIRSIGSYIQGRRVTPAVCSVAAAGASLGDTGFVTLTLDGSSRGKEIVYASFDNWGVEYIPSSTNFVFFKTERFQPYKIVEELGRRNVLIRNYGHVPGWARVSIGKPEEMQIFVDITEEYLA